MYRRRYRRRRFNGLWLPQADNTGGVITLDGASPGATVSDVTFLVAGGGYANQATSSLLSGQAPGSLSIAANQAWIAKRIVGSIFVGVGNSAAASAFATVRVAAAIFHETVGQDEALSQDRLDKYNPLDVNTSQTRKLWQRVWLLNNPYYTASGNGLVNNGIDFPTSNAEYGSIREGTHVDVKSKATMELGSNLFLGVWASVEQEVQGNEGDCIVWWTPNLRVFGKVFQRGGA